MTDFHPTPSALLAVAHEHQEKYEAITRQLRVKPSTASDMSEKSKLRTQRMEEGIAVENNALLAIAGFLERLTEMKEQELVCEHGTRGWCRWCHQAMKA